MVDKLVVTDGGRTKAINPWDIDGNMEAWTWLSNAPKTTQVEQYSRVAAAFRAYNLKANTISNVPFILYKKNGDEYDSSKQWQNKVGFLPNPQELFRLGVLSYIDSNTIYNLRTTDILGYKTRGLYHAISSSFTPIIDHATGDLIRIDRRIGSHVEHYDPDDKRLVRLWRLDHTTEVLPSPNTEARAIMGAAGVVYYADVWIEHFFRRGGIKPTLIAMKGMIGQQKKEDAEKDWSDFLRGLGKRFTNRVARIFNAETMDIKPFGSGVDDIKDNHIYETALANIAMGTGMPLSLLLANSSNYATAREEKGTWFENDIIPFCTWLQYEYNTQVFNPLGLYIEFKPETLDPNQEDETERAGAINQFMDYLMKCPTADIAKETALTFGYELTDGLLAAIDAYFVEKERKAEEIAAAMQQQTPDATMPADQPDMMAQDDEDEDEEKEKKPAPARWMPTLDELEELRVWREVALRKFKRGEDMQFEYQPHYGGLPDQIKQQIAGRLAAAQSAEDIKAAFTFDRAAVDIKAQPAPEHGIINLAAAINNMAAALNGKHAPAST